MAIEGTRRPSWAEIDLMALRHNVTTLRHFVAPAQLCGVVKANGYGHGALFAARALLDAGVAGLAVAIVDEGVELRDGGITEPILLLAEAPAESLADALEANLTLTVGSLDGAHDAVTAAQEAGGLTPVHVKVDTGMHRMGVVLDDLGAVLDVLHASPNIVIEGMYSHFAVADSDLVEDREYCETQMARFEKALAIAADKGINPPLTHLANSAAAIALPAARRSMVRVGLAAYGYLPHPSMEALLAEQGFRLRPALSLHARVTAIRQLDAGDRPSYGRRRALPQAATVATVPFGYADGYPRRFFDAGAEVLINGVRHPLAGSVTMDQLVVDCVGGEVRVGDDVVLLGTQGDQTISADEWAAWGGTITWEILCGIGARVPRISRH
jgi:alanine racemase